MKKSQTPELPGIVRRFIQDLGSMTQSLGIGRVVGQIYAFLYFSPVPRNLSDMQAALGISKGSASTGVRQLDQWSAVRKVWIKGDRKDYYEANDWLGKIMKNAISDMVGAKLTAYASLLQEVETNALGVSNDGQGEFIGGRIEHLRQFHSRTQKVWNSRILKKMLS